MKKLLFLCAMICCTVQLDAQEYFPDGKPIPEWFGRTEKVDQQSLGRRYRITDYGAVADSMRLQTACIQHVIDMAAEQGGGVIVIPQGTFLSGSLFFKPGTHLHLERNAVLKGSDDVTDFSLVTTRMEGQTRTYYAALVNADGLDGFTISGEGMLNGNGFRFWRAFWARLKWNPQCTNMDEQRPRIIYLSNCRNVQIEDIRIANSPYWSTHYYKCSRLKLLGLHITTPRRPIEAPSTDAVDLDVCDNVLIKNCYMSVCDDAVSLKGGKGPWADRAPDNGSNEDIIIEDCTYGYCHSALTCGSESVHNRNVIFRRSTVDQALILLHFKMRPDTPQRYEHLLVEDIRGNAANFMHIAPWSQFYDLGDREDIPLSYAEHITMRDISLDCGAFFNVAPSEQYRLSDFRFENLDIRARQAELDTSSVDGFRLGNVKVNGRTVSSGRAQSRTGSKHAETGNGSMNSTIK